MNILIIGNGFDIAHQLPTTYSDFLSFVKAFKGYNKQANTKFDDFFKENYDQIETEFSNLIKSNIWIDYCLSKESLLLETRRNQWIDFESEISIIVKALSDARECLYSKVSETGKTYALDMKSLEILKPMLKLTYQDLFQIDKHYSIDQLDALARDLLCQLDALTRALEIFLSSYVMSYCDPEPMAIIKNLSIDSVLSFNYTNTYEKLYDQEKKVQYCYVHGKADIEHTIDTCNMVLGIDEFLDDTKKDNQNYYAWFKKFFQRIYKGSDSKYLNWVDSLNGKKKATSITGDKYDNLYIYGHSLAVTDKDILSKLILADKVKTYIYYHRKNALSDQINNLIKVIGEEELIRRTGGANRTITFIPTYEN